VKKNVWGAFLIVAIMSGLVFAGSSFGIARASTSVMGIIESDTVWTKVNSPYELTGAVGVISGVTLTIEAGVTVNLSNNYIQVNGTLRAIGTATDPILFNEGRGPEGIIFTESSSDWNETTANGSIIENAVINSAGVCIENVSPKISNNTFHCRVEIHGGAPLILNNRFIRGDGLDVCNSNATISGNVLSDNYQAMYVSITNSSFTPLIERNLIVNNVYGIGIPIPHATTASPIIRNNTIANNTDGICIWNGGTALPVIIYNNIYGNTAHNFRLTDITNNIDATQNWWGTTGAQTISQSIYDFKNDFSLGNITFVPFLTELNPQAMPDPNMLTQLPSPTPTPESSATPSPSLTASPTPDSNNFNIESNSTVSAFSFNSSIPEITFTVNGTTGTTGYVKATISKNFMPNAENIKVYLDGNQIDYNLDSTDNSWIVTFTYQHSTHQVAINAAKNPADDSVVPDWIWQATIIIAAASLISAACLFIWFRKTRRGC